jgi:hypothetical protein
MMTAAVALGIAVPMLISAMNEGGALMWIDSLSPGRLDGKAPTLQVTPQKDRGSVRPFWAAPHFASQRWPQRRVPEALPHPRKIKPRVWSSKGGAKKLPQ